jgi:salicylate hydroxylase
VKVAIIGGGIGGLNAGLFLHRAGHDVTLLEQAQQFSDVGAGIQLSPNATRLLERVGVLSAIDAFAVRPVRGSQRRWTDGSVISSSPMGPGLADRFGAPYLHVHRADLVTVLADALTRRIGAGAVHLGARVDRVESSASSGSTVHLADGTRVDADLVVGADGIHSVVRTFVNGANAPAQYSGHVAYRAVFANQGLGPFSEPEVNVWLGPGAHVVHYLLRKGELFNLVAVVDSDEQVPESWNEPGDPAVLRERFADWAPALRDILDHVSTTMRWALHDHQPLETWHREHVCVLGDAAHPMLPYLAQGGAQSIEDGAALADCLRSVASTVGVSDALRTYQARRKDRATAIQLTARQTGAANHLPDGPAQQARDEQLALGPRGGSPNGLDIYGHDAELVS